MSTFQHTRCVGLMALSCSIMLLSGGFVSAVGADSSDCNFEAMGDGVCNTLNNNAECGELPFFRFRLPVAPRD